MKTLLITIKPVSTMKARYINPFTDFGFKKLFGEEAHKNLLIHFLNALLPAKHQILDLEFTKNEALGDTALDRKAIFDITCTSNNGERFIVELQKAKQNFFKDRSVFYSTFPIREQAERGDIWNYELAAVYCIGILDFVFDEDRDSPDYLHTVQLKNQRNTVFYDKLTFVYLEMPKFTKTEAELQTQTDKWLYFIKHLSGLSDAPESLKETIFEEAFQTAEIARFDRSQADAYERSLKYYRDLQNVMNTAIEEAEIRAAEQGLARGFAQGIEQGLQQGIEQGLQQGIEQGLQQGIEQGLQQGIEQGLQQGIEQGREVGRTEERKNIARIMKTLGVSITDIIQATGLSEKEIAAL